ncbi:MAG: hypothetical protein ABI878_08605 [Acidobacteriota bacterium]
MMPNYNWRFADAWPDLYSLIDRPLPNAIPVNYDGSMLTSAWIAADGISYLMNLSTDMIEQIESGLLFPRPTYYQQDPDDKERGTALLLALEFVSTMH